MAKFPSRDFSSGYSKEIQIETNIKAAERARIVRDGVQVSDVRLDEKKIDAALVGIREVEARVATQSIPAGTPVAKNTTINLVMVESNRMPAAAVDGIHAGMAGENLQGIYDKYLKNDAELVHIIARAGGDPMPPADRQKVKDTLTAKGLPVNDLEGTNVDAALLGLQAGYTFGGHGFGGFEQ